VLTTRISSVDFLRGESGGQKAKRQPDSRTIEKKTRLLGEVLHISQTYKSFCSPSLMSLWLSQIQMMKAMKMMYKVKQIFREELKVV
jgi:hypothetical protein